MNNPMGSCPEPKTCRCRTHVCDFNVGLKLCAFISRFTLEDTNCEPFHWDDGIGWGWRGIMRNANNEILY
jgi:hypothetical protein